MGKKSKKSNPNQIAFNKRARFEYAIEETLEAGLVLQGWEVKAIRAGQVQFTESYVMIQNGEAFIIGCHISPLKTASTHIKTNPTRNRKLLLHARELSRLIGAVERKGYSIVPITMYWKGVRVKVEIGFGKGKKLHDKRETKKDRDWDRQKERIMKHS